MLNILCEIGKEAGHCINIKKMPTKKIKVMVQIIPEKLNVYNLLDNLFGISVG